MFNFIMSIFFALGAFWMLILTVKNYINRDIDKAIQSIRYHFNDSRTSSDENPENEHSIKLRPHKYFPLSEEMIKELATMEGHNYRGSTILNSDRALVFTAQPRAVESLRNLGGRDV